MLSLAAKLPRAAEMTFADHLSKISVYTSNITHHQGTMLLMVLLGVLAFGLALYFAFSRFVLR
jgi:hypothetical protein